MESSVMESDGRRSSINELPPEIIRRIIWLSCPLRQILKMNRYLPLMKICGLWRNVIQNDPMFWNLIDFGTQHEDFLIETLERSKATLLTIIVPFNFDHERSILQSFFTSNRRRVENLYLKPSGLFIQNLQFLRLLGQYRLPSLKVFTMNPSPSHLVFLIPETFPITISENIKCLNISVLQLDYFLQEQTNSLFPHLQILSVTIDVYSQFQAQIKIFTFLETCSFIQSLDLTITRRRRGSTEPLETVRPAQPWDAFPILSLPELRKVWINDTHWSKILSRFHLSNLEYYDISIDEEIELLGFSGGFDYSLLHSLQVIRHSDERRDCSTQIVGFEESLAPPLTHAFQPLRHLYFKGQLTDPYPDREMHIEVLNSHVSFYLLQCSSLIRNITSLSLITNHGLTLLSIMMPDENTVNGRNQTPTEPITPNLRDVLRNTQSLRKLLITGGDPSFDVVLDVILDADTCPRLDQLGYQDSGPHGTPFPANKLTEVLRTRNLKGIHLAGFKNMPEEWMKQYYNDNTFGTQIVVDSLSEMLFESERSYCNGNISF